ncbi:lipid-A-disaccharide synthase [uncultured Microscilla sp.]|uniref:lipid-A-disaccharide synthase n=1 Tax=uncultured Microscilla sp. TaxID=432653 RepID=UPI0026154724|nr:lipid-A-disaccharide synthase [uncultured Microscilla sp.]
MKYYVIAGERSGDLHASNLMKAIQKHDDEAAFRFWGGDEMQKVGGSMVKHYRETAFMGFVSVVKNLGRIRGFMKLCKQDILNYQPDVVVLVDYAGFNLRIAKFAKKHGFNTFFYISPKVWAWNTKRAYKIKANIDRMFVIFPFEQAFYQQFDYEVDYVGNPLLDAIANFTPNPEFRAQHGLDDRPIIALLPGSRKQEVERLLPIMLGNAGAFPSHQLIVAGVNNLPEKLYEEVVHYPEVKIIYEDAYNLLTQAEAAVVTSGTATLETGLFEVPQVVVYKTNAFSFSIAKRLIKVAYISLVNLVLGKEAVKELIQQQCTADNITQELTQLVKGGAKRAKVMQHYTTLKDLMGETGASARAGTLMVKHLKEIKGLPKD